jgi:hypothetical protein
VSWPYGPNECPRCHYFERLDPAAIDDAGYEIVGVCRHPRIATDLFLFKQRDATTMESCPCFTPAKARIA